MPGATVLQHHTIHRRAGVDVTQGLCFGDLAVGGRPVSGEFTLVGAVGEHDIGAVLEPERNRSRPVIWSSSGN